MLSFQTRSEVMAPVEVSPSRLVPPQARTYGSDAGKSQCSAPSATPSVAPLSPVAAHTVIPSAAASEKISSIASVVWPGHLSSDAPQLVLIAVGVGFAWTAVENASIWPCAVLGAKYTTSVALGASAPGTSTSSMTSLSALGSVPGLFVALSTPTAVIDGAVIPRPEK